MAAITNGAFTDDNSSDNMLEKDLCSPYKDYEGGSVDGEDELSDQEWSQIQGNPKIGCRQHFSDCSNVFKAFIGAAMIGLPFATLQAGIGLAMIGVFVISIFTDHCCILIVKCKRIVIKNLISRKRAQGVDEDVLLGEELSLGRELSFGKIGKACLGIPGVLAVNISVMITQLGFTIGYFIFLGNTMRSIIVKYFVKRANETVASSPMPLASMNTSRLLINHLANHSAVNLVQSYEVGLSVVNNSSYIIQLMKSTPGFAIFLAIPLPLLILIAFIRNLRKLGPVSVIANSAMTGAFAATAIFIIIKMKTLPDPILWFKLSTFPIFFGQVTSAFEGIGTVIPIEGSMSENRPKYPFFLHISLAGLAFILAIFGITGYLAYGNKTCQIITANLEGDFAIVLQILLFTGVLFTYPLQIYPCIQIVEHLFLKFRKWKVLRKIRFERLANVSDDDEGEALIENIDSRVLKNVKLKRWESNLIRAFLVTLTAVIALLFRSQFAYIAALTGSIGSSLLSYILPPLFHIRLQKNMSRWVKAKDIMLIIFGIIGGATGVTVTIQEIIDSFSKGHPPHC